MSLSTHEIGNIGQKIIDAHVKAGKTAPPAITQTTSQPVSIPALPLGAPRALGEYGSRQERERMEAWITERVKNSQKTPIAEVVTMTPMLAALLLLRNKDNRPFSELGMQRLKDDILKSRWRFNGESLVVAKDGSLIDGQHRAEAVIGTNRSIQIVLVFGADREARTTIDQGIVRSAGHFLKMKGYTYYFQVATIGAYVDSFVQRGRLAVSGSERATKQAILACVEHYSDIPDCIKAVERKGYKAVSTLPVLGFCYWAFSQKTAKTHVDLFFDKLISGEMLRASDPILVAKNRLIAMGAGVQASSRIEVIFRAWNAYRRGDTVKSLPVTGTLPKLER